MRDIKVGDHVHFDGPHFMCAIVTEVNDDGTYTAQAHHEGNKDCPEYMKWSTYQAAMARDWIDGVF